MAVITSSFRVKPLLLPHHPPRKPCFHRHPPAPSPHSGLCHGAPVQGRTNFRLTFPTCLHPGGFGESHLSEDELWAASDPEFQAHSWLDAHRSILYAEMLRALRPPSQQKSVHRS